MNDFKKAVIYTSVISVPILIAIAWRMSASHKEVLRQESRQRRETISALEREIKSVRSERERIEINMIPDLGDRLDASLKQRERLELELKNVNARFRAKWPNEKLYSDETLERESLNQFNGAK